MAKSSAVNDAIAEADIVATFFRNLMLQGVDAPNACTLTSSYIFARRSEVVQMEQFRIVYKKESWEGQ